LSEVVPSEFRGITAPLGIDSYPGITVPVAALMSERLVTPKVVPEGLRVTTVFSAERSCESVASSFTRYVPAVEKVALVDAAFGV
jgi:hypothetical protein